MGHIYGENRYQARIICLDDYVAADSTARAIDRFVDSLDLAGIGFKNVVPNALGRSSYKPAALAKLYVYGYENGIRSSRRLEALTKINIEMMWLMDELTPDFKTIADFRKDNCEAFVSLLSEYNSFADYCGLSGKELAAIDGTKIKASNNKKNNYNKKKLARNIEYDKRRIQEYLEQLGHSGDMEEAAELTDKIAAREDQMKIAESMLDELEKGGANEISTVDEDARLMASKAGGVEMAYNVQASVDGKAHMAAAFDITQNSADHGSLTPMIEKTQEEFRKKDFTALADKGYYGYEDIEKSEKTGAVPIVARQQKPGEKDGGKFTLDKFIYDSGNNRYLCPAGKFLYSVSKSASENQRFTNKDACKDCPSRSICLDGKSKYKVIRRRAYMDILDRADARYKDNYEVYKLRQQIVEHVFGTIKRTMNGGYYLLRSKEKVKAETALLFLGYNIKRTKTELGIERMMELMDEWKALYSTCQTVNAILFCVIYRLARIFKISAVDCAA